MPEAIRLRAGPYVATLEEGAAHGVVGINDFDD